MNICPTAPEIAIMRESKSKDLSDNILTSVSSPVVSTVMLYKIVLAIS